MMYGFGYTLRYFVFDLASMILFLVLVLTTGNVYLATGLSLALGIGQLVWCLLRRQPVGVLQWMGLGLVVVFGGATLLLHDPRFIMFKPTAVHVVIGASMLKPGWMERYAPPAVREIGRAMFDLFGFVWAGLMFAIALLNLVLVFTVSPAVWAKVNLFADPVAILALFIVQNAVMRLRLAHSGIQLPKPEDAA